MPIRFWLGAALALAVLAHDSPAQTNQDWRPGGRPTRSLAVPTPTAAKQNPAIVRVWARQAGSSSGGSGTLVGIDERRLGLIITNRHVVADGGRIEIHWPTGNTSRGKVEAFGGGADDLAAIFVRVPEGIEPVAMRDEEPAAGDTLWIAGYGGSSQPFDFGPGQYVPLDDVNADIRGTPARHGDSGGPILDADGKVSGVLWGSTGDDGGRETVCIRLPRVREFLRKVAQAVRYNCAACGGGSSHSSRSRPRADAPDILDGGDNEDFAGGEQPRDPYSEEADPLTPVAPPTPKPNPAPKDDGKIAGLEKQLTDLASRKPEPGPAGPPGAAGPMGQAGAAGKDADGDLVLALTARLEIVERELEAARHAAPPDSDAGSGSGPLLSGTPKISHIVLLVDRSATTWQRIASTFLPAAEKSLPVHVVDYSHVPWKVQQLPQAVVYDTQHKAVAVSKGARDVEATLAAVTRGELQ